MDERNVNLILNQIKESDIVLDIGGGSQPFNRADYCIDIIPYEARGGRGSRGPKKEFFSKDSWIVQDLCERKPLPFGDKEIDFVICSHVLEDIRDPIYLCSEIVRIGKKGYIEVPSRNIESIMCLEGPGYAGRYHHRWLIEIEGSEIIFRFKTHLLHSSWKYHLPKAYLKKMSPEEKTSSLFWKDNFQYKEVIDTSIERIACELEDFVIRKRGYPSIRYLFASKERKSWKDLLITILKKQPRLGAMAEKILGREIVSLHFDSNASRFYFK